MRRIAMRLFAPAALVGVLLAALAPAAEAHSRLPKCQQPRSINAREQRQQKRIAQGIRSGELTRREARRLEAEQARIRVDEAYARRSGGEFTARERARIQRELNQASRHIYRQKHDSQDRN